MNIQNLLHFIILLIGTAINRSISIVKINLNNGILGNDHVSDIIFIIDRFLMTFRNLLGYSNIETLITSYLTKENQHDLTVSLLYYIGITTCILIGILNLFSGKLALLYSINSNSISIFTKYFLLLSPTICYFSLLSVLNATYTFSKSFGKFTFFPIISNLIFIICLILLPNLSGFILGNNLYSFLQMFFLLVYYKNSISKKSIFDFKFVALPDGFLKNIGFIFLNFLFAITISMCTTKFFSHMKPGMYTNVQYLLKFIYTIITTIVYSQTRIYTKEIKDVHKATEITSLLIDTITIIFVPIIVFIMFFPNIIFTIFANIKNPEEFLFITKCLMPILCLASYNYIFSWTCVMKQYTVTNTISSFLNTIVLLSSLFIIVKYKLDIYVGIAYTCSYGICTLLLSARLYKEIKQSTVVILLETIGFFLIILYKQNILNYSILLLTNLYILYDNLGKENNKLSLYAMLATLLSSLLYIILHNHVLGKYLYFGLSYLTYVNFQKEKIIFLK